MLPLDPVAGGVDLALIVDPAVMGVGFRGGCRQDRKGIVALRFGHDEQLVPVIFPVAEVDDERMAAVMFAQQRDGQPFPEDPFEGGEDVLPHVIVSVGHPMFVAQLLGLRPELLLHDMRQLPAVADDDDIPATGAADGRREDIDLRRLVDDDIVEQVPRADRSAQRMGRTQHDRIAFDEGAEIRPVVLHRERGSLLLPRFVQPFVFAVEHIAEQRFRHLPVRFDQALRTLLIGRCPEPGDAVRELGDVGFVELAIGIGGQQLRIRE